MKAKSLVLTLLTALFAAAFGPALAGGVMHQSPNSTTVPAAPAAMAWS